MKYKVLKMHILRPTLSTDMVCGGRGKKGALVEKKSNGPWQRNIIIIKI